MFINRKKIFHFLLYLLIVFGICLNIIQNKAFAAQAQSCNLVFGSSKQGPDKQQMQEDKVSSPWTFGKKGDYSSRYEVWNRFQEKLLPLVKEQANPFEFAGTNADKIGQVYSDFDKVFPESRALTALAQQKEVDYKSYIELKRSLAKSLLAVIKNPKSSMQVFAALEALKNMALIETKVKFPQIPEDPSNKKEEEKKKKEEVKEQKQPPQQNTQSTKSQPQQEGQNSKQKPQWNETPREYEPKNKDISSLGSGDNEVAEIAKTNAPYLQSFLRNNNYLMRQQIYDAIDPFKKWISLPLLRTKNKISGKFDKFMIIDPLDKSEINIPVPYGYQPIAGKYPQYTIIEASPGEFILKIKKPGLVNIGLSKIISEISALGPVSNQYKAISSVSKKDWPASLAAFLTSLNGLSPTEAASRLEKFISLDGGFLYYSKGDVIDEPGLEKYKAQYENLLKKYPPPVAMAHLGVFNCDGAAWIASLVLRDFLGLSTRIAGGRVSAGTREENNELMHVVRSSDPGHAWIEVWDGRNWIPFDMTPKKNVPKQGSSKGNKNPPLKPEQENQDNNENKKPESDENQESQTEEKQDGKKSKEEKQKNQQDQKSQKNENQKSQKSSSGESSGGGQGQEEGVEQVNETERSSIHNSDRIENGSKAKKQDQDIFPGDKNKDDKTKETKTAKTSEKAEEKTIEKNSDSKSETKGDSKVEIKSDSKTEVKKDSKSESKNGSKSEKPITTDEQRSIEDILKTKSTEKNSSGSNSYLNLITEVLNKNHLSAIERIIYEGTKTSGIQHALEVISILQSKIQYKNLCESYRQKLMSFVNQLKFLKHEGLSNRLQNLNQKLLKGETRNVWFELQDIKKIFLYLADFRTLTQSEVEFLVKIEKIISQMRQLNHPNAKQFDLVDRLLRALPGNISRQLLSKMYGPDYSKLGSDACIKLANDLQSGRLKPLLQMAALRDYVEFVLKSSPDPRFKNEFTLDRSNIPKNRQDLVLSRNFNEWQKFLWNPRPGEHMFAPTLRGEQYAIGNLETRRIPDPVNPIERKVTVVYFDISGSMGGRPSEIVDALLMAFADKALSEVDDIGRPIHEIHLIPFNDKLFEGDHLVTVENALSFLAQKLVNKTIPGGGTDIQKTILNFYEIISLSYSERSKKGPEKKLQKANLVLFTDGGSQLNLNQLAEFRKKIPEDVQINFNLVSIGDNLNPDLATLALQSNLSSTKPMLKELSNQLMYQVSNVSAQFDPEAFASKAQGSELAVVRGLVGELMNQIPETRLLANRQWIKNQLSQIRVTNPETSTLQSRAEVLHQLLRIEELFVKSDISVPQALKSRLLETLIFFYPQASKISFQELCFFEKEAFEKLYLWESK